VLCIEKFCPANHMKSGNSDCLYCYASGNSGCSKCLGIWWKSSNSGTKNAHYSGRNQSKYSKLHIKNMSPESGDSTNSCWNNQNPTGIGGGV